MLKNINLTRTTLSVQVSELSLHPWWILYTRPTVMGHNVPRDTGVGANIGYMSLCTRRHQRATLHRTQCTHLKNRAPQHNGMSTLGIAWSLVWNYHQNAWLLELTGEGCWVKVYKGTLWFAENYCAEFTSVNSTYGLHAWDNIRSTTGDVTNALI